MVTKAERVYAHYNEVRDQILDGDLLLYRGKSVISRCIQRLGRSPYSHIGMAGWTNGGTYKRLMAHEVVFTGGRMTSLSSQVKSYSGCIDVYRLPDTIELERRSVAGGVTPEFHTFDRAYALALMRDFCQPGKYGYWHFFRVALRHTPFLRFLFRSPTDDALESRKTAPFCSEAVCYAVRHAFIDLVQNTPDHFTEPGDVVRSPLPRYLFTLVSAHTD